MTFIAATLVYNTPDLAEAMQRQLPTMHVIDNGSEPPIPHAAYRYEKNLYFTGGWNRFMRELPATVQYVWMLNSDIAGIDSDKLTRLAALMAKTEAAAISPCISNSRVPHMVSQGTNMLRPVNWLDWPGPIVNRGLFMEAGGFEPEVKGFGADIDLCYRLRRRGHRFYVHDGIDMRHLGSLTVQRTGVKVQNNFPEMRVFLDDRYGWTFWPDFVLAPYLENPPLFPQVRPTSFGVRN